MPTGRHFTGCRRHVAEAAHEALDFALHLPGPRDKLAGYSGGIRGIHEMRTSCRATSLDLRLTHNSRGHCLRRLRLLRHRQSQLTREQDETRTEFTYAEASDPNDKEYDNNIHQQKTISLYFIAP